MPKPIELSQQPITPCVLLTKTMTFFDLLVQVSGRAGKSLFFRYMNKYIKMKCYAVQTKSFETTSAPECALCPENLFLSINQVDVEGYQSHDSIDVDEFLRFKS